jgi:hypothetical protein
MDPSQLIVFDSLYWTLLIVNVIPFLISLVTNVVTRKGVKEGLLFILTGGLAWAEEVFAAGGSFVMENFITTFVALFLGSAGFFFAWQRKTIAEPLERSGLSLGAPK